MNEGGISCPPFPYTESFSLDDIAPMHNFQLTDLRSKRLRVVRNRRTELRVVEIFVACFRFVVPESAGSLKLVFDNVRNYGICAGLIVFFRWQQTHPYEGMAPMTVPLLSAHQTLVVSESLFAILIAVLLIANGLQTLVLLARPMLAPVSEAHWLRKPWSHPKVPKIKFLFGILLVIAVIWEGEMLAIELSSQALYYLSKPHDGAAESVQPKPLVTKLKLDCAAP